MNSLQKVKDKYSRSAWLAVDKDGSEHIFLRRTIEPSDPILKQEDDTCPIERIPIRWTGTDEDGNTVTISELSEWRSKTFRQQIHDYGSFQDVAYCEAFPLPLGTIEQIVGRPMTFDDDPWVLRPDPYKVEQRVDKEVGDEIRSFTHWYWNYDEFHLLVDMEDLKKLNSIIKEVAINNKWKFHIENVDDNNVANITNFEDILENFTNVKMPCKEMFSSDYVGGKGGHELETLANSEHEEIPFRMWSDGSVSYC